MPTTRSRRAEGGLLYEYEHGHDMAMAGNTLPCSALPVQRSQSWVIRPFKCKIIAPVMLYAAPAPAPSPLMQLFDPRRPLVHAAVDGSRHGQRAADDGAHAGQEAEEGLGALFAVDHFHGGDVLLGMLENARWRDDANGRHVRRRRRRRGCRRGRAGAPCGPPRRRSRRRGCACGS